MLDSVRSNFPDKFSIERLYHYTTERVLDIFLNDDACLYCTNVEDLNDEIEFKIGLECGLQYLKRLYSNRRGVYNGVSSTIEAMRKNRLWHGWVMSFTSKADDLNQWRAYTDSHDGGYAIGFDYRSLTDLIATQNTIWMSTDFSGCNQPYILYLFPCFYQGHDNVQLLLDLLFQSFAPAYANTVYDEYAASKENRLIATVVSMLLLFASIYKQESFHDECETRLVMLNQFQDGAIMRPELIGGKRRIKAPMFPDLLKVRDLIQSVTRSPHGNRSALEKHMEYAREMCGKSFVCEVSTSSYRTS